MKQLFDQHTHTVRPYSIPNIRRHLLEKITLLFGFVNNSQQREHPSFFGFNDHVMQLVSEILVDIRVYPFRLYEYNFEV